MKLRHLFFLPVLLGFGCMDSATQKVADPISPLELMGIEVAASANREFSYSDGKSGYFYGKTHADHPKMWFAGWNINRERILRDYRIFSGDSLFRRDQANVTVYPHYLERRSRGMTEKFYLVDKLPVLVIEMEVRSGEQMGIELEEALVEQIGPGIYAPNARREARILIAPIRKTDTQLIGHRMMAPDSAGGFLIAYGEDEQQARDHLNQVQDSLPDFLANRQKRMEEVVQPLVFQPEDSAFADSTALALAWLQITLDQLIMDQTGKGIYAGLPWFNDYWGRDQFISLPGACLTAGKFETAKQILLAFAAYQNQDSTSKYYGRMPNRLRPDEVIYNSVDAFPRFVLQVHEYWKYTGDSATMRQLFPAVKRAITGVHGRWEDKKHYLTHEDADTWMDAKENGTIPWSPRGNRAVDVQALWYQALFAAAEMAAVTIPEAEAHLHWREKAKAVKFYFRRDFGGSRFPFLADHLNKDDSQDWSYRPNFLFALEDSLIPKAKSKANMMAHAWGNLVYPWGVASLIQSDPNFHPYHEHWHYYHKDAAYHNGTVWLWLNGIAMQRMVELGQQDLAWQLMENMLRQALEEGAVGSLAENADALPREDTTWARRSGTFLQAWSNAEHLRVWYQYFLGVRPDMRSIPDYREMPEITFAPRLPPAIDHVAHTLALGSGNLAVTFDRDGDTLRYQLRADGIIGTLKLSLEGFPVKTFMLADGKELQISQGQNQVLVHSSFPGEGKGQTDRIERDAWLTQQQARINSFFTGVAFCQPELNPDLECLQEYHDPPLTY